MLHALFIHHIGAEAVTALYECVSQINEQMQFTVDDDTWPPGQLKSFIIPQYLIHYHSIVKLMHASELVLAATDQSGIKHHPVIDSNETVQQACNDITVIEKLKEILAPLQNDEPCMILVEGAPGIGKSVLLKEIAYQWSKKQLLQTFKIVLLVCLHEPTLQQAKSLPDLLQHFCNNMEIAVACSEYFYDNGGRDLVFLVDGFDELPEKLQRDSFIMDILERHILPYCGLVISSRPLAIHQLRKQATLSVDIVGFTEKEQLFYIQQVLHGQPHKLTEFTQYLKHHFTISGLCHIPFNLIVLLYMYNQGIPLPKTPTGLYGCFICHTICQHFSDHPINFTKLTDLPEPCYRIVQQLSKLSLEALHCNKSTFTSDEIKAGCLNITAIPGNINGLGLLRMVDNHGISDTKENFKFLHFSIQEYLAALHVANLPADEELLIIERNFWNNAYFNMFSTYITVTNGQQPSFRHFLSDRDKRILICDKFLNNQFQCIRLYQYFHEVGDVKLCKSLEQSKKFSNRKINLTYRTLTTSDVESVTIFLTSSFHKEWVILDLSSCYIRDRGLYILHRGLQHHNDITINKLWLINNHLTTQSSSLISDITIKCKVKELVISGNYFMGEDQQLYSMLSSPATTLEELDMSGTKLSNKAAINLFRTLQENNKLKKLHVTYNAFTDDACSYITVAMKNSSLERLIMYGNQISDRALVNMVNGLQDNNTLANIWLPKCSQSTKKTIYSLEKVINKNREDRGCQIKLMIKL